jgi:hypothetical protein
MTSQWTIFLEFTASAVEWAYIKCLLANCYQLWDSDQCVLEVELGLMDSGSGTENDGLWKLDWKQWMLEVGLRVSGYQGIFFKLGNQ